MGAELERWLWRLVNRAFRSGADRYLPIGFTPPLATLKKLVDSLPRSGVKLN
jgi:hypothetical protein